MKKLLVVVILALGIMTLPSSAGAADPAVDEAAFVSRINELRAGKGLPALQVHENLVQKARAWAATMAGAGRIWHSTLSEGISADWLKLGENVGMGGGVDSLHGAFVASPRHYENLIDPSFGHVGIGVVYVNGTLYVSEMFMKLGAAVPSAPSTVPVVAPPAAPPVAATPVAVTRPPAPPAPKRRPVARPAAAPAAPVAPAPAAVPVPVADPVPTPEPAQPSPLLVSVLERLRDFN